MIVNDVFDGATRLVVAIAAVSSTEAGSPAEPPVLSPETIAALERTSHALHGIRELVSPLLVPLCAIVAWLVVLSVALNAVVGMQVAVKRLERLHSIPCSRCAFFTDDYRLKCPVDPISACTEDAIGCPHYEPKVKPKPTPAIEPAIKLETGANFKDSSPVSGGYEPFGTASRSQDITRSIEKPRAESASWSASEER